MRALVTGGGRRLGRAMALELARRGYDVAVHFATSAGDADRTAQEIRTQGRQAAVLQADLLDEGQTQALLSRAARVLGGPVTCLINNLNRSKASGSWLNPSFASSTSSVRSANL